MSDILDRAEDLAERYNSSGFIHKEATLLLPDLIAEIKRQAAYVARLEAAYLAAETEKRKYEKAHPNPFFDSKMEYWSEREAREALERIKRGEQE